MNAIVAIPSSSPGGLEAPLGVHFGHCELYTVIEVERGEIRRVEILPNVVHQQGGCMTPVRRLAARGVQVLIAGGMGLRPLLGFSQVGIRVFHDGQSRTVGQALLCLLQGRLPQFSQEHTCGEGRQCHA